MGNVLPISAEASGVVRSPQAKSVKVIATTAGKGGVGKTTVSINLALALAKLGKRTMLLDADLGLANIDTQLGLQPKFNLSHVVNGDCALQDIVLPIGPRLDLVPAASGVMRMAELARTEQVAIINSFSELTPDLEVLIIDNAPGLSSTMMQFVQASHEVIVVVCDEPASITDAYAVIKVLSREYNVSRFRILVNMVRRPTQADEVFTKIARVADRFLNVTLVPMGGVPHDDYLLRAIQEQVGVVQRFPGASSSNAFTKLAKTANAWPVPKAPRGHIEFFVERMLGNSMIGSSPT